MFLPQDTPTLDHIMLAQPLAEFQEDFVSTPATGF
jgi:hypothetical protein